MHSQHPSLHHARKPIMNGVAQRRNRTLNDMVRSTISFTSLPHSLCGDTLKIDAYILNRALSKATDKTSYELWTNKKSSLNHFHVWGCPAEAKPYRTNEGKLDANTANTVSSYFVRYAERYRGYEFYDLKTKTFLRRKMISFLRMLNLEGKLEIVLNLKRKRNPFLHLFPYFLLKIKYLYLKFKKNI